MVQLIFLKWILQVSGHQLANGYMVLNQYPPGPCTIAQGVILVVRIDILGSCLPMSEDFKKDIKCES